jgi:hypothetical protein
MAAFIGLTIAALSPRLMAMVKKAALISSRCGRPKEIFETPSTV